MTDAHGCFTLSVPADGRWTLHVSRDGYESADVDARPTTRASASGSTDPICEASDTVVVGLRATAFRASEQVVVTAARQEQGEARTARSVSVVDADELHVRQPRSTPEALENLAGVLLQKTNHGSGAPYVQTPAISCSTTSESTKPR